MAGQGVATGKISLAVELIDNYKQIASQLKNGLKGNLKDYELDVGFNDETLAKQAEGELGKINELLSNGKFKELDWSNVIPPLTQVLANGDLAESVKVQIIEGFRRGIEEVPQYYEEYFSKTGAINWEKIKPGEEIAQQVLGASIFNEAIESFGMKKGDTDKFKKQYKNALGQHYDDAIKDIIQMMSNVSLVNADKKNKEILPYMLGKTASKDQLSELFAKSGSKTDKFSRPDLQRAAALTERLKYIASQTQNEKDVKTYADAEKQLEGIIQNITNREKGGKYTQEDISTIIGNIRDRIAAASKQRDEIHQKLNPQQYGQKDIPKLLNDLREMVQGKRSEQVKTTLDQYDKASTLNWDQLFNIITPEEEPVDLRYDENVTNWLESLAGKVADERSEEKKQRDEEARKKAQISQAFKNLFNLYGKTGVDSSIENIEGMVDPASFTDKLEGDVDHLTEQRQEVEKQADELQRAKEELEKENIAIVKAINGQYEQKGIKASKNQLLEKQEAYDKADESNKDLAWIEYYKAYQNMVNGNNGKNMPSNLSKIKTWDKELLDERLARDFGDDKEFNIDNLRERILNLKQKWIENSTELQNLLKTIAETESQKRAIDEQIANIQTESKPTATTPEVTFDGQNELDIEQLEQQRKALEEELKTLENQRKEQEELNSAIQDVIDSINEGELETKDRPEAETVLEQMYESDNDDIRDLARYWETSGETGASFGALESYGEDVQAELANLEEQIEARKDKIKEISESIKQMSSTPIETEEPDIPADGEEELSGDEKLKNLLENKIKRYTEEQKELQNLYNEINKIINDKGNFNSETLINHENEQIATWANNLKSNGKDINIEALEEYNRSLEADILDYKERIEKNQAILNNVNNRINGVQSSDNAPAQPVREQANANEALGESANNATGAVEGLSQAQRQGVQAGQQASETARNASESLHAEAEAANADAEAQRELAAQRQNANNAQPPSTPANPAPAPTPEAPPTHPETPVRTGNIKGMQKEEDDADNLTFKFISAAEAKQAFVDANKDVKASAEASAKSIEEESKAALKAKFGFDPEELQKTIDTTQQIQTLLTQVSTAIDQMGKSSDSTGIVEQLTKVVEAMGLIVESAQQVGSAMSTVQAEGGLKVDLQNGLDINPLIEQFEVLNEKVLALVTSLANVQSAIGAIDDNSGLPNLLSQIQNIASSLETISQKDLGFNFNISNTGNAIQQQAAKDRQALKELRSQAESLEKYFSNNLGKDWEGMLRRDGGDNYFKTLWSTQDVLDDKKSTNEEKMEAYKRRIDDLKQYAIEAGADLQSILPKTMQAPDAIIDSAKNFALDNSPTELIKQIFGGDNSAVLDTISGKIQEIIGQLNTLNSTLSSLSDGSNLTGLKEVFEQIPQKIEAATQKIFELKQQIDTSQFSAGFDEQFKGLTEQLEAAKEQTKATNEELKKTTQLLDEEKKARADLQKQVDQYKKQDSNAKDAEIKRLNQANENRNKETANRALMLEKQEQIRQRNLELQQKKIEEDRRQQKEQETKKQAEAEAKARVAAMEAKRQAEIKAEQAQIAKEDTALGGQGGEYIRYKADYKELYNAKTIEQYNTALMHLLDTEQRIQEARQQAILSHGTATDIMQLSANGVEGALSGSFLDGFTKSAEQQKDTIRAIQTMQTAFIDEQQASIAKMTQSFQQPKNLAPEVVSGWGEQQRAEYQKMVDGANLAKTTIESLNRILTDMRSGKFNFADQNSMEVFMELKNVLPDIINNTQQVEQSIGTAATNGANQAITELDKIESSLLKIKDDSQGFIVVDDNLKVVLSEVEKHLQKIKDLKDIINNNPLSVLQTGFSTNLQNYLTQMNGSEQQAGIVQEAKSVYKESETAFKKVPQYFTQYGNALKRFFDYLSQGGHSLKEIIGQMDEVQRYAQKLTSTTGLDATKLLNGNLGENATQAMTDNQESARAKYEMGFQSYLTSLNNQIKNAESTLQRTLGTQDFGKAFERFTGSGKSFDDFKAQIEGLISALQKLKDFEKGAKAGGIEFFNEENLKNSENIFKELMPLLDKESFKEFSKNASGFKIIDDDTLSKARAEMQKFINDNPALSGDRISAIRGYIDQLQSGINNIDYTNAIKGFERIKTAAIEANNTGSTFFSELQTRFKSLGTYLLSFVSFYEVIGVFKDGINIIHELDDALTEMQKVSDESLSSLREYQKGTFDTANEIGTTAAQLQQSTADWMRLGEDLQQASQSAQTANVLFNVSEFDNIDEATTALVAMSAAYADAEKDIDKMDIVDRLNLIGNNYAIATDELATALQDGAATLQTAGKQHCQNL